jgi:acetyltransferase-like isoleucine patch superfamily enzyme
MKKWIDNFLYVRKEINKVNKFQKLANKINKGQSSFIEHPVFKIDLPECISLGKHTSIGSNAWISCYDTYHSQKFSPQIIIGDNVRIGNYAFITSINEICIGNDCLMSDYVFISDHTHGFDPLLEMPLSHQELTSKGKIVIGEKCFIGVKCSILPGVTLGRNCVVGANSVVTKSFPSYSMVGGNPARLIKKYSFTENKWLPA